jgi:cellulose synthase/poly-beta-1,6-N-acetylglucosamine synthase-like glycosyltransferase
MKSMSSLLLLFPFLYAFQVLKWCFYLKKKDRQEEVFSGKVSWVVPFKNEEKNLDDFFRSIQQQSCFPVELILVDDGSTDASVELINRWIPTVSFSVILMENQGKGKKRALTQAVEIAKGEIVVCSDADCTFSPQFLHSISQPFSRSKVVWVSGRVVFHSNGSFWKEVLAAENEGLQAITAASIRANQPTMANGAAMAFRKSTFHEVGGYRGLEHLASGDDELLLHRMWGKGDLVYAENAVVNTHSVSSWSAFWRQRKRWVSKSGDYENKGMQMTMMVAWLSRCSWLISMGGINYFGGEILLFSSIFLILPEVILLQIWGLSLFRAILHVFIQGIYSLYVVFIPFLSKIPERKT